MLEVNERSNATLSLAFYDETGAAVVPDSGRYCVEDVNSGTLTTTWTTFTPTTSSYDINLTPADNIIIDDTNDSEVRRVTVVMYYSSGRQCSSEYKYTVNNLMEIPPMVRIVGAGGAVAG